ncbi:MAG: DUF3108 domain-containing protein [Rhizobiales bacterium]|nr:DUF3108 domain-containing protein [Hyphomicrobiales bacterium]
MRPAGQAPYRADLLCWCYAVARIRTTRRCRRLGGWSFVLALRQVLLRRGLGCTLLALALGVASSQASAAGRLEARYTASLAGIPIGKGSWVVDINDTQYTATANGTTTGLLHAFTGGQGKASTRGTLLAGRPVTANFASTISASHRVDQVQITIVNGTVKEFTVDPPQDNLSERVPIAEAHRHDVLDPMTASLLFVPGNGNPLSPNACQQTLSIFDGRLRYDLQLVFKRLDKVKADKGYAGPVVVCAVYFTPIAGYIPSRTAIKYVAKLRDIEIWMAPIAGTRVLAPFRVQGPTLIGKAVLEADEFVSVDTPTRASVNGAKVQ